jgi:hypothetical protein
MPDLIRHPEHTEMTGFRLPDQVRHRLRRNDALMGFQTFYETINFVFWCLGGENVFTQNAKNSQLRL